MSTGLIAGGSLAGIIIALLVVFEEFGKIDRFFDPGVAGRRARVPGAGHRGLQRDGGALFAVAMIGKRPVADAPGDRGKVVFDDIGLQEGP